MRKLFWLAVGIFAGLELKKQLEKNPEAKAKFDEITDRLRDLRDTAFDSFNERTSELAGKPATKSAARKSATTKVTTVKPKSLSKKPSSKPAA